MRGGGPLTRAGGLSGGNQQKVVVAREVARDPKVLIAAQPTRGLDVGAIEYLHRRLVEERDEGRAILLISLELEEVMSLSDRILVMYEGEIVGEHSPDVTEQETRPRDARRAQEGSCGVTATERPGAGRRRSAGRPRQPAPEPTTSPRRHARARRMWLGQRAGGIVVPVRDGPRRVPDRRRVVAATGHNPLVTYRDIFNGAGLNWFFHPTTDTFDTAAYNLSQTMLQTTTLILTGLAVAFAFRCGMFNIGGQGQYFVGCLRRDLDRLRSWVEHVDAAARPDRDRGRDARRRALGRDRRLPEGDASAPTR